MQLAVAVQPIPTTSPKNKAALFMRTFYYERNQVINFEIAKINSTNTEIACAFFLFVSAL